MKFEGEGPLTKKEYNEKKYNDREKKAEVSDHDLEKLAVFLVEENERTERLDQKLTELAKKKDDITEEVLLKILLAWYLDEENLQYSKKSPALKKLYANLCQHEDEEE